MPKKIGFLFGAGAEVSYGMPTGGAFALDIFRQDPSKAKNDFKEMRAAIDKTTTYAGEWLPENFDEKNIGTFGKSVFGNIIKDTIEHNREKIIYKLNNFDIIAERTLEKIDNKYNIHLCSMIENIIGRDIDDINLRQRFAFAEEFSEGDNLFASKFFSSFLLMYKENEDSYSFFHIEMGKIIISIIQLQVGALSEALTRRINDSPFRKKDDDIDLFDDLGELINLNYSLAGVAGLEYLLDKENKNTLNKDDDYIILFARKILESIFSDVIDYKSLIDSNWHYLYCPKIEWNKFCKISIFLFTVRNYIEDQCKEVDVRRNGYYDDVNYYIKEGAIQVKSIATTNYTNLIKKKIKETDKIHFLNGSTELWYDPYINRIEIKNPFDNKEKSEHFEVPLLFTQSGTKPMTSIYMSQEYVTVYNDFYDADIICIVGFGFNTDDEHINGILRELINNGKRIFVVTIKGNKTKDELKKYYMRRLKINTRDSISVIMVDYNRKEDDQLWIDRLLSQVAPT